MRSEFRFIENLKKHRNFSLIGDDCAILPGDAGKDLLVTADMLVEDIDFKLEWASPEDIGFKSLAVSLSDIAAMGGSPKWSLISIGVPAELWNSDFVERFYDGYCELATRFGIEVAGGDVSRTPERFVIDSVVGGEVSRGQAIRRSGARVGDTIWVSGTLGGAAAGLRHLLAGRTDSPLARRQLRPEPRVELGETLLGSGVVTSMIDISDGLSGDLMHICHASNVGAQLTAESIPVEKLISGSDFVDVDPLEIAINGGEDFELLLTAASDMNLNDLSADLTAIGVIDANAGRIELSVDGKKRELKPGSFQHFRL